MTNDKTSERNRRNGQYAHSLDVVCVCGKRKGEHMAEAPYEYDSDDGFCEGFKKAPVKK